jgi:ATP/maltotriose-dependent transcriptional regulator MalT
VALAGLRYASGDVTGMRAPAEAAVRAARAAEHQDLLAEALVLTGSVAVLEGGGERELAEAQALAGTTGDAWVAAHAGAAQGQRLLRAGDVGGSAEALREAEQIARALASPFTLATVLNGQATLAVAAGDDDVALERLAEAVTLAAGIGTTWTLAYALPALGALAARRGEPELATELFAAGAEASSVTVAYPPDSGLSRTWLSTSRSELGEERFRRAWERGRELRVADVPGLVARLRPGGPE